MKEKTNYCKPSMTYVQITLNDLCAGSVCTSIDLNSVKIQQMSKKSKTKVLKDGGSKDMWDSKF